MSTRRKILLTLIVLEIIAALILFFYILPANTSPQETIEDSVICGKVYYVDEDTKYYDNTYVFLSDSIDWDGAVDTCTTCKDGIITPEELDAVQRNSTRNRAFVPGMPVFIPNAGGILGRGSCGKDGHEHGAIAVNTVPEPSTVLLLGLGLLIMMKGVHSDRS